jgi:hypothetical protein
VETENESGGGAEAAPLVKVTVRVAWGDSGDDLRQL